MKCPLCACTEFYVKDPDDEYDIHEFTCKDGEVVFNGAGDDSDAPDMTDATEAFCDRCAWHGKMESLE